MIPEYIDGLPNICGSEEQIAEATSGSDQIFLQESRIDFSDINSAYAIALHMHQPLVPLGSDDLQSAEIISNLQYMMEHPEIGDNHNAKVFHWCYKRMGEFIPELVEQGKQPRVMLDYSGTLLHGMRQMGLDDVFDALRTITCDSRYYQCIEWLGSAWGHPVAPSTPMQDYYLHVKAWQHFFAALFGIEALRRVRGFSPAEMAIPNHPDVFYEFVKTLKDCGYRWVIVQEHTVEHIDSGRALEYPYRPHRLLARNSHGETLTITAIIKTQGSDTKLIGQMQPYYEAQGLERIDMAGRSIPSLVSQIADGENGGVMMNEFPSKYHQVMGESSGTQIPPVNVTEYLEYLDSLGVVEQDFPAIQPIMQQRIWNQFDNGNGPEAMEKVIKNLQKQDDRFHMEGGSWTNNISWVQGYEGVLKPMEAASAMFNEKILSKNIPTFDSRYRNALYHLLIAQTSCYRYWGEGEWTDRGREICRRTIEILKHNF